jgi:hypothetical protein
MADDTHGGHEQGKKMSWQERETMLSLARLANARANLATLEEQAAGPVDRLATADPVDRARVEAIETEIDKLRAKARGRFGAGAREKIGELELQQRLILDRIGFPSFDAYRAAVDTPVDAVVGVDATQLEMARREFADAERAFIEITSMVMPPVEVNLEAEAEDLEHDAEIFDLPAKPSAAS